MSAYYESSYDEPDDSEKIASLEATIEELRQTVEDLRAERGPSPSSGGGEGPRADDEEMRQAIEAASSSEEVMEIVRSREQGEELPVFRFEDRAAYEAEVAAAKDAEEVMAIFRKYGGIDSRTLQ